jgi:regulator of replication initiation timing
VGGAQTSSHERLVMITKRKQIKYMNEVVIMLMQENEKLIIENKKLNNLLDLTLIKSGSPQEEQSY